MLRPNGTLVVSVHFGFVDTDMTAAIDAPKHDASEIAAGILAAIEADQEEAILDPLSQHIKASLSDDQNQIYPGIRAQYEAALASS